MKNEKGLILSSWNTLRKEGIWRSAHFVPLYCLSCLCHKSFNTFHICIYHKTLECLEMTRRGKGPSGEGAIRGPSGSWKDRKSHLRERDTEQADHTCEANVKLELGMTGVLGEEQLFVNISSLWRLVLQS